MDIKSSFLYGKIEEEVYVCQLPGFEDPDFPDKVYKIEKALYKLHEAPKAWFIEVKTASTPMETQKFLLKDIDGEEVDVHMYRSMIGSLMYLTSSRPDIMFAVCACARYQVNPKVSYLYAVKRIFSAGNRQWLQIPHQKLSMWLLQVVVDKFFGFRINYLILGKGYHTKRQKTKQEMTKPGTEWKSCEGQGQSKAKDQISQSQSQLNKSTVKTKAVIEEYYWLQSQPI
ncbi:retrovirus-related pol polyprotein from transposon TNT 1-94 [Tanacetum coccineum]